MPHRNVSLVVCGGSNTSYHILKYNVYLFFQKTPETFNVFYICLHLSLLDMLQSKLPLEIWMIVMFVQFFIQVWIMRSHQSAESQKLPTSFQVATLFPLIFTVLKNPLATEEQCVILSLYFPFRQSSFFVSYEFYLSL